MKRQIIITSLLIAFMLTSCKTTIPTNDSIMPTLTVALSGDGVNINDLTIDDIEFDTKAFYLKRNTQYTILFSGKDAGGVEKVTWEYPTNNITIIDPMPSNWSNDIASPGSTKIKSEGNSADPRSSILFSNKFTAQNNPGQDVTEILLKYTVKDFSGNLLSKQLRVFIGAGPTRIGPR